MAEQILHFGAFTFRINGNGFFRMTLFSLDKTTSQTLVPFTMQSLPGKEPTRLCNFMQQRAILRMETTAINEYFRVNRYVAFVKAVYTQYPGTE